MPHRFATGRHAGVLVPLFSMPSTRSWGIGEIADLVPFAAWLEGAGLDILQLLPVSEMASGQHSPYSAMSAMAIDPIFISVQAVDDFLALGGETAAGTAFRDALAAVRASPRIAYGAVRALKMEALRAAFGRFRTEEWHRATARAGAFRDYLTDQGWWLEEYALFRALRARHHEQLWTAGDAALRVRRPEAIRQARTELSDEILFYQYLQWVADGQWQAARAHIGRVGLFGDLPFMVSGDSADVWIRQDEFRFDASVGTPPDAFSQTGQDWGFPPYRWDVVRDTQFAWLRGRARRAAALYDGYRVDHLVGFYRTYVRPLDGSQPRFEPPGEREQVELGEAVMQVLCAAGAYVVAEDLGTVPDWVRASLTRMGIPGHRVLRWERQWQRPGRPFRNPAAYPPLSLATTGTHDVDPIAAWWDGLDPKERARVGGIPLLRRRGIDYPQAEFGPDVRDGLLEALFASGSNLLILPVQDVFGWTDRINVPAVVSSVNWTYRLPWPVDCWDSQPEARERAAALRAWGARYGRGLDAGGRST